MFGVGVSADSVWIDEVTLAEPKVSYREIIANVSAYTSAEGGSVGAWGDELQVGYAAADDLPRGTVVVVCGSTYIIMDRFGGDYVNRLDLYMEDESEAWEFGRKELKVYVKED